MAEGSDNKSVHLLGKITLTDFLPAEETIEIRFLIKGGKVFEIREASDIRVFRKGKRFWGKGRIV